MASINTGLNGKVALITGANHGIGAATAKALAAQGTKVLVSYLKIEPDGSGEYSRQRSRDATSVLQAIRAAGGTTEAIEADLSEPDSIPTLFDRAESLFGPVEILVNNAAYWQADMLAPQKVVNPDESWHIATRKTITPESIDRHFAVNARAVALMIAEFARRLSQADKKWGRIINLTTGGAAGFPSEVSYGASKAALESYSRAAAYELGYLGITVNMVSPGPTQTGWIEEGTAQDFIQRTPPGRLGMPDDIADVIVFLASEQARWVTGQLIHVDGGFR